VFCELRFFVHHSPLTIRYSPFATRCRLPICRFHDLPISSARQEPRPPITLTHYALRITLTSFPFLSWHNCDEDENGAGCDVRCWVRCAECGVQLMGFVHQIYGLKSERELALCISNEWVSAHSVGMRFDRAR